MDLDQDKSDGVTVDQQAVPDLVASDGGFGSRKLWLGVGTSAAIVLGGVGYALWDGFRGGYGTYISGLLGVLALYLGGNVGNKFVMAKHYAMQAGILASRVADKPVPGKPDKPRQD